LNFESVKAYILYFSYHTNDYDDIDDILNQIITKTEFNNRYESLDFNLYCFYKGNIFLIKKNFTLAAFSYLCSLYHLLNCNENFIDDAQISMIRRLTLLYQTVDSNIQKLIKSLYNRFKKLKNYYEINKYINIIANDKMDDKDFENFIEEKKNEFTKNNISGLARISLNEYYLNKVKKNLKYYKRIKLSNLQKIIKMDINKLKNIIFYGIYNNKLNVQYDEDEDVLEVNNDDYVIYKELEEVKNYYSLITNAIGNLYLFDKQKTEEINKYEKLNPEMKHKYLMEKQKNDNINDDIDFND
jgi:hypothetical protein